MIISHKNRFIFFHNPKTAGMSLRPVLLPHHDDACPPCGIGCMPGSRYSVDFAHLRLWEIAALFPSVITAAADYRSVIFVRDPYRRFVSAIDQHFKTFFPEMPLPTMHPEQQTRIVEIFIEQILNPVQVKLDHRLVHFSPQIWFLQNDGLTLATNILPVDDRGAFIARGLECLGLPPQLVAHENRSRSDLSHILLSPRIRSFVRDFYAEDFAFLAADPALVHLAAESDTVSARIDRAAADLAAGRTRDAFEQLKAILSAYPDVPRALGMLGQIAVLAGEPAVGLASLQRAVALDPQSEYRLLLVQCLEKLGCHADAASVRRPGSRRQV